MKSVFKKVAKALLPSIVLVGSGAVMQEVGNVNPELEQAVHVIARAIAQALAGV